MNRSAAALLGISMVVVLFGRPEYAVFAAVVALSVAWILDPGAVRVGLRLGIVLAIAFAAAVTAAVVAWSAGPERGLVQGGMVLLRLLVLTSVAAVVVRSVDAEGMLSAARKAGLERVALVLGLALNSLPRTVEAVGDVWIAHRVRSGRFSDLVRRLPALGEVLLAHTARIAEEAAAAASLRGHTALTKTLGPVKVPVRTVVVTGPPDCGKTRAIGRLASTLSERHISVAGFEQPAVMEDGRKIGFDIRDLETGEQAPLARLADGHKGDYGSRFRFSGEGFEVGGRALARASCSAVVVVDELGPVELRGDGHMPAVERALAVPDVLAAVLVVRRSLVPSLVATLDATDVVIIDVEQHPDDVHVAILEALALESEPQP